MKVRRKEGGSKKERKEKKKDEKRTEKKFHGVTNDEDVSSIDEFTSYSFVFFFLSPT